MTLTVASVLSVCAAFVLAPGRCGTRGCTCGTAASDGGGGADAGGGCVVVSNVGESASSAASAVSSAAPGGGKVGPSGVRVHTSPRAATAVSAPAE
eukprot:CAMPEP_0119416570 /NCGR_PEP_ID=MMETSP1335-20130426/13294_1 /TAXON_ID=259385 /ORGANISM="Chrysoculter rhomboideus, Strain RCC1486" /LENGTH=95 /DNA_ID=CAMNT_0007441701 /DNA_START=204 /DNA_END=491 /DNA_ORIENTATION=+